MLPGVGRPLLGRVREQRVAVRGERRPLLAPLHAVRDARVHELTTTRANISVTTILYNEEDHDDPTTSPSDAIPLLGLTDALTTGIKSIYVCLVISGSPRKL